MNLIETPAAPTAVAVAHEETETVTTVADVHAGDFVVLVHAHGRTRGLRANSQVRTINPVQGSRLLAVEFTSARGAAYRIHPDAPVTVRRATRFETV